MLEMIEPWVKEFRKTLQHKLCEITPSICEDSKQAEWTVGELNELIDAIIPEVRSILSEKDKEIERLEAQIRKLKFLLTGSVQCNQRLRRWIQKSDHLNGCSFSRKLPLGSKCDCDKLKYQTKFQDRVDEEREALATLKTEEGK